MTETMVEMLQRGESRARGYNDYNRYAPREGGPGHFRGADRQIDFSEMTLGEIRGNQRLNWNHADKLHAVGRYQVIGNTLQAAMDNMGLDPTERYTPALQDRILVDYLMDEKRPDIRGYITGREGVTLREAQVAMANEWASVGHPDNGRSVYPNNHASITPAQSAEALQHARDQYAADIARGMSPDDAWRAAAGLGQQRAQTQSQTPSTDPSTQDAPRTPGQSAGTSPPAVLKQGSEGAGVRALQESLTRLGYTGTDGQPLRPDSNFGPNTDHAVRAFQTAHGLQPVDGKVGPDTRTALAQAAERPLVSEATHPNNGLYNAIGAQMPAGTDPKVTANVTLQAMENGITDQSKLARMAVQGSDAYVQGTTPGDRVKVDLTAPTPDLQVMSDHMAQQASERAAEVERNRTRTQEPQTVSV